MEHEKLLREHFDAHKAEYEIVMACVNEHNELQDKILQLEREIKECQKRQRHIKQRLDNTNPWCYIPDDYIIDNRIRLDM